MATTRVKKAIRNLGNSRTEEEALVKAGFSSSYAKSGQIKKTRGWLELMEKNLPDHLLTQKHRELLEVPKKVRHFKKGDLESEYEELDSQAISKGLDMAYKLKGKYAPEKTDNTTKIEISGNPEVAAKFDEFLKRQSKES